MSALFIIDIDECVNSSMHSCSEIDHEIWRNLEGSYECDCNSGFERHGSVCQDNYYIPSLYIASMTES